MAKIQVAPESNASVMIRIWDLPVRLFHWTLVAAVAMMWVSAECEWFTIHLWLGQGVLALMVFRLIWGVVGSRTARFASFVKAPREAIAHLAELRAALRGGAGPAPHLGHNPAGAYMVLVLLALVLTQAVSGLFASDDILVEGPLNRLVPAVIADLATLVHSLVFDLIVVAVVLHVCAIGVYRWLLGQDLVRPMISGRMAFPAHAVPQEAEDAGEHGNKLTVRSPPL